MPYNFHIYIKTLIHVLNYRYAVKRKNMHIIRVIIFGIMQLRDGLYRKEKITLRGTYFLIVIFSYGDRHPCYFCCIRMKNKRFINYNKHRTVDTRGRCPGKSE